MCVRECVLSSLPPSLQHTLTHPLGLTYFFLNLKRMVTEKKNKRNRTKHLYTATGVLLLASPHLCSLSVGRGR